MAFINPSQPNLTDFYTFVTNQGVPSSDLPSTSEYLAWALNYAIEVALPGPQIGAGLAGYAGSYVMATYNLGLHQLLKVAQDVSGNFFATVRQTYGLTSPKVGVVMASEDQGTSQTLVVPEFFSRLTLSDLDLMKTPYGREYLGYAQMYGSTIVDFS